MPNIDYVRFIPSTNAEEMAKKINCRQEKQLECQLKGLQNEKKYTKNILKKNNVAFKNAIDKFYSDADNCLKYTDADENGQQYFQLNRFSRSHSKSDLKPTMMSNSSAHRIFHKDKINAARNNSRNTHKRLTRSVSDPASQIPNISKMQENNTLSLGRGLKAMYLDECDERLYTLTLPKSGSVKSLQNDFVKSLQSHLIQSLSSSRTGSALSLTNSNEGFLNTESLNETKLVAPPIKLPLSPSLSKTNFYRTSSVEPFPDATKRCIVSNDLKPKRALLHQEKHYKYKEDKIIAWDDSKLGEEAPSWQKIINPKNSLSSKNIHTTHFWNEKEMRRWLDDEMSNQAKTIKSNNVWKADRKLSLQYPARVNCVNVQPRKRSSQINSRETLNERTLRATKSNNV